jgi:hypothetical protein
MINFAGRNLKPDYRFFPEKLIIARPGPVHHGQMPGGYRGRKPVAVTAGEASHPWE